MSLWLIFLFSWCRRHKLFIAICHFSLPTPRVDRETFQEMLIAPTTSGASASQMVEVDVGETQTGLPREVCVSVWKNCSKCWEIQPKVTQNKGNSWISIATSKRTWSWIWFPGWLHERFSFGVNTYFCTWRDGDSFVWIQSLLSSLLGLRRSPVKNGWRCIALFVHISD